MELMESGKYPDRDWLLKVMSIWAPNCVIFDKSYRYVRDCGAYKKPSVLLWNEDNMYDDLPVLPAQKIRKTNQLRLPRKVKEELKLAMMQQR